MADLAELEEKYREAQDAFAEDKTDENHEEYKKAKHEFAQARAKQKQLEEEDPNHPRGQVMVVVNEEEGE